MEFTLDQIICRYPIGELRLPYLVHWVTDTLGVNLQKARSIQDRPNQEDYPTSKLSNTLLDRLIGLGISYSVDVVDRLFRAHGHTLHDMFTLKHGKFSRIPDVVLWPTCHQDVVKIVEFARDNNLVVSILVACNHYRL